MYIILVTMAVRSRLISVNIRVHDGTQLALVMDEEVLGEDFFRNLDSSPTHLLSSGAHVSVK